MRPTRRRWRLLGHADLLADRFAAIARQLAANPAANRSGRNRLQRDLSAFAALEFLDGRRSAKFDLCMRHLRGRRPVPSSAVPRNVKHDAWHQIADRAEAKRVLVVEDELMIRMLLEDMLDDLGYTIAAEAGRDRGGAGGSPRQAEFDVAILDVNLNGQPISPVAEVLVARGLPFVFATGYGERGLPEPYRDRPTLQKPFQADAPAKRDCCRRDARDGAGT